ncbi:MAG: UDP-N-acetylmuramoyl-L-alanine--D-glutamate ligase [Pseudomonadota bacterium]
MSGTASILIVGLGKTGLSVARFLASRGLAFAVADSRMDPPGLADLHAAWPGVETHLGGFDAEVFSRYKTLVVSPGVSIAEPAIQQAKQGGAEIIGDIELFARHVQGRVIAITGSNGKSTATTLVGELLAAAGRKVAVGGNLGTPALELLQGEPVEFYVLELSSFQLETTHSLKPLAAVVLNVSEDHMDRYAGLGAYAEAKGVIYRHAGVAVANREDVWSMRLAVRSTAERIVSFGLDMPQAEQWGLLERAGEAWLAHGDQVLVAESELTLRGRHNMANALAALALVGAAGVEPASVIPTLRVFAGLPHRSQVVGHFAGLDWINDSKGTNIGATAAALAGQTAPVVLIAGGIGKGQDFSVLRPLLAEKARGVVLIGQDAECIAEAWQGAAPLVRAGDMADAVQKSMELGQPGDVVLLSPACASFDMFKGYDHRGEVFAAEVRTRFGS